MSRAKTKKGTGDRGRGTGRKPPLAKQPAQASTGFDPAQLPQQMAEDSAGDPAQATEDTEAQEEINDAEAAVQEMADVLAENAEDIVEEELLDQKNQEEVEDKPPLEEPPLFEEPLQTSIRMPIDVCHPGYATPNIDFNATRRQAAAAKVLWSSLAEHGERVRGGRTSHPDGKAIEGVNDGMRWLLDRLADQIEAATDKCLATDFGLEF